MTDDISKVVREMREAVQDGEPMKFRYLSQWADRLESATTPAEAELPELPEPVSSVSLAAWGPKPDYYTADQMREYAATLARQLAESESALAAARQELAQERALSTAISNDCNAVANERNALRDQLAAATRRVAEVEGLLNRAHEWLFSYGLAGTLRGEIEDALQKEPK